MNNPYNNQFTGSPSMYGNNYYQNSFQPQPHYEIITVNGKPGVDAFKMAPNSSTILVDETGNLIWFVRTDGAGYKEATPFTITPYVEQPPVDINALCNKVSELESIVLSMQQNRGEVNESNPRDTK